MAVHWESQRVIDGSYCGHMGVMGGYRGDIGGYDGLYVGDFGSQMTSSSGGEVLEKMILGDMGEGEGGGPKKGKIWMMSFMNSPLWFQRYGIYIFM